jgi:hypothetical protein
MLSQGETAEPTFVFSQIEYERQCGKPKVVSSITDVVTFDMPTTLTRDFDVICGIDTNCKAINAETMAVAALMHCRPAQMSETNVEYRCSVFFFAFKNCPAGGSERYAWSLLLNMIMSNPNYNQNLRIAIITDHDLGRHPAYNSGSVPIWRDIYLPPNVKLVFATSDSGRDNFMNEMIVDCDKESSRILKQLEETGTAILNGEKVAITEIQDVGRTCMHSHSETRCDQIQTLSDDRAIKWELIRYTGKLPDKVYRFRTVSDDVLERIIDFEILQEGIYLAGMNQLNDPNEGRFVFSFEGEESEVKQYWLAGVRRTFPHLTETQLELEAETRTQMAVSGDPVLIAEIDENQKEVIGNLIRVACFSTDPLNNAMWAHYGRLVDEHGRATAHGGVCLEYECDEGWRDADFHPIVYSDEVPVINILTMHTNEQQVARAMYTKETHWSYEQEWRVLATFPPPVDKINPENARIRTNGDLKSVIFGLSTPGRIKDSIAQRVRASRIPIALKQVQRDKETRKLVIVDLSN